jgi:hypothetical protein
MSKHTIYSVINGDFKTMHEMLSAIELKISGVEPFRQIEFYTPVKNMIFEAWCDTCNSEDSFLFKQPSIKPDTDSK